MITFDTFYTIQRVSGLSQDDKPLGMKPGSIFMELDTGKTFIFDGETWHEQPSGGGSGVQSDWNQNDDTKPDYVKNRPFYTVDHGGTVLLEETTATFQEQDAGYVARIPVDFTLKIDTTYKVSWDGTVYSCVGYDFNGNDAIGNQYIVTGTSDTGEPFIVLVNRKDGNLTIVTKDTSASHTISITEIIASVIKIDKKYLPKLPYMDKVNPTGTGAFSLNRKADTTVGSYSFAEGTGTTASGIASHAEGEKTTASGSASHAEGLSTKASSMHQHVQGRYNINDSSDTYAHIVGNGTADYARSNAHTLDWSGNAWFAGTVEGKALILPSSTEGSTKKFKITVDDSGTITATEVS